MIYLKMPDGREYEADEYDGILSFTNRKDGSGFAKWSKAEGVSYEIYPGAEYIVRSYPIKSDDTWA